MAATGSTRSEETATLKTLILAILLCPVLVVLLRSRQVATALKNRSRPLRRVVAILAVVLVMLPIAGGVYAASTERIIFHDEATVLATTAAFWHGQPIYPPQSAPVDYALLYGPSTYLAYLPPMLMGAARIGMYQLWVVAALALTLIVFYCSVRPAFGALPALCATALLSIFIDFTNQNEWAIKGDVWILFFSAAALLAALRLPRWSAAALVALSGAFLIDLKATLLPAALLPVVLLWERDREYRFPAIVSACSIPLLALAPFAVPGISLSEYSAQLLNATRHGFSSPLLAENIKFAAVMLLPTVGLLWFLAQDGKAGLYKWLKRRRSYLFLTGITLIVAVSTGSKNGAGPWHCMALAIPLAFINVEIWHTAAPPPHRFAQLFENSRSGVLIAIALVLIVSAARQLEIGLELRHTGDPQYAAVSMPELEKDLVAIIRRYPNERLQMGYSDTRHYDFTFVRPLLQIYGSPLFIDPDARNEEGLIGRPVSAPVMAALRNCEISLWILPHGGEPFSMDALYYLDPYFLVHPTSGKQLYPDSFRLTFLKHYQQIPSMDRNFDLWKCRKPAALN